MRSACDRPGRCEGGRGGVMGCEMRSVTNGVRAMAGER